MFQVVVDECVVYHHVEVAFDHAQPNARVSIVNSVVCTLLHNAEVHHFSAPGGDGCGSLFVVSSGELRVDCVVEKVSLAFADQARHNVDCLHGAPLLTDVSTEFFHLSMLAVLVSLLHHDGEAIRTVCHAPCCPRTLSSHSNTSRPTPTACSERRVPASAAAALASWVVHRVMQRALHSSALRHRERPQGCVDALWQRRGPQPGRLALLPMHLAVCVWWQVVCPLVLLPHPPHGRHPRPTWRERGMSVILARYASN